MVFLFQQSARIIVQVSVSSLSGGFLVLNYRYCVITVPVLCTGTVLLVLKNASFLLWKFEDEA